MKKSLNHLPKWAKGLNTRAYHCICLLVYGNYPHWRDIDSIMKKSFMIRVLFQQSPSLHNIPGCGESTRNIIYEWAGTTQENQDDRLYGALYKEFPWLGRKRATEISIFCRNFLKD